ncbi:MAG: tripartite tricarboxylate transporter permease [Bacillota bacterium]|nr:tripartite tricarboxylate transporter permease [Bacillota bacterium]
METILSSFLLIFTVKNIFILIFGTLFGLVLGAIPGLGSMILLALLLPITYFLEPAAAILLMLSAYQGGEYGGSISSIILGIPGTPSASATVLDGYKLALNESPGVALAYSLQASFIGAIFGGLVLLLLSAPLASFALKWSAPEYFLVGVLGIIAVAALSSKDIVKSVISVLLGLMAATIGLDIFSGLERFTMGRIELIHGLSIISLIIGVFGIPEIFKMMTSDSLGQKLEYDNLSGKLNFNKRLKVMKPTILGAITGSIIGIFPGLGSGTSSWFGYALAKKTSKDPKSFGEGNPDGIVGPEAANNAAVGGALLPLLTLGIPGSPAIAIIMGAFIMQGIQPGPSVFSTEKVLVYTILIGFIVSSFIMLGVGRLLTPLFARVVIIPNHILAPIVLIITIIGIYVSEPLLINLWVALIIGVSAYYLVKIEYSAPSFVLAFVLGPIIEKNFRRALQMSDGDFSIFYTRNISIAIIIVIAMFIIYPVIMYIHKKYRRKAIS